MNPYFPQLQPPTPTTSSNPPRVCTVKGCNALTSGTDSRKMCDRCRERHRKYATTKRAKRKAEKAVAFGSLQSDQPNSSKSTWESAESPDGLSPDDSPASPNNSSSQIAKPSANGADDSAVSESTASTSSYNLQSAWDNDRNIDPLLFHSSSELAGALTYEAAVSPCPAEAVSGASSALQVLVPNTNSTPSASQSPTSQRSCADIATPPTTLHARYCTIKGCKAVISGSSEFKMCDSCRDRYRSYGTTKRAKWKREREDAQQQIEKLQTEIIRQRSGSFLSPASQDSPLGALEPVADQESPTQPDGSAMKPCTVSHCRQLIPTGSEFVRCEQHRLQNRYHSRLKREREKEIKTQAKERWAEVPSSQSLEDPEHSQSAPATSRERVKPMEPLFTTTPMDLKNREARDKRITQCDLSSTFRGKSRVNHVCSVKICQNLLSPTVSWKTCERCREHDRLSRRKNKALHAPETEPQPQTTDVPATVAPSTNMNLIPSNVIDNEAISSSSSAGTETGNELSTENNPSQQIFNLMFPNIADAVSSDTPGTPYPASFQMFTSAFQPISASTSAQLGPSQSEPSSSAPRETVESVETSPSLVSPSIFDEQITEISSNVVEGLKSDATSNDKREIRRKRGPYKKRDKTGTVVSNIDSAITTSPPQDILQTLPTTVSPQSVEINPAPCAPPVSASSSFYSSPYPSPMLFCFMQSASQYGLPPPQYLYPSTCPYTRPPYYPQHYPPPLPPYPSPSYRASPISYPYHYPSLPYVNISGHSTPSYVPTSYPHLQWSTNMTPQAPPPEYVTDDNSPTSTIPPEYSSHLRKHKRNEADVQITDPSSSSLNKDGVEKVSRPNSSPMNLTTSNTSLPAEVADVSPPKKRAHNCSKVSCHRPVSSNNMLCDRCKEKFKRRQLRAKKRFRLEPKVSLIKTGRSC